MSATTGLLQRIRRSWWLEAEPCGLVLMGDRAVGVLTVRVEDDRDYWRIAAREPLRFPLASRPSLDDDIFDETVTLRRGREPEVWHVMAGEDVVGLCDEILPVIGPLPAPWAVLFVAQLYEAAALARILVDLRRRLSER